MEQAIEKTITACVVCNAPSTSKCGRCHIAYYCGTEHQREHWKDHKQICRPRQIPTVTAPGAAVASAATGTRCCNCDQPLGDDVHVCLCSRYAVCRDCEHKGAQHDPQDCISYATAQVVNGGDSGPISMMRDVITTPAPPPADSDKIQHCMDLLKTLPLLTVHVGHCLLVLSTTVGRHVLGECGNEDVLFWNTRTSEAIERLQRWPFVRKFADLSSGEQHQLVPVMIRHLPEDALALVAPHEDWLPLLLLQIETEHTRKYLHAFVRYRVLRVTYQSLSGQNDDQGDMMADLIQVLPCIQAVASSAHARYRPGNPQPVVVATYVTRGAVPVPVLAPEFNTLDLAVMYIDWLKIVVMFLRKDLPSGGAVAPFPHPGDPLRTLIMQNEFNLSSAIKNLGLAVIFYGDEFARSELPWGQLSPVWDCAVRAIVQAARCDWGLLRDVSLSALQHMPRANLHTSMWRDVLFHWAIQCWRQGGSKDVPAGFVPLYSGEGSPRPVGALEAAVRFVGPLHTEAYYTLIEIQSGLRGVDPRTQLERQLLDAVTSAIRDPAAFFSSLQVDVVQPGQANPAVGRPAP